MVVGTVEGTLPGGLPPTGEVHLYTASAPYFTLKYSEPNAELFDLDVQYPYCYITGRRNVGADRYPYVFKLNGANTPSTFLGSYLDASPGRAWGIEIDLFNTVEQTGVVIAGLKTDASNTIQRGWVAMLDDELTFLNDKQFDFGQADVFRGISILSATADTVRFITMGESYGAYGGVGNPFMVKNFLAGASGLCTPPTYATASPSSSSVFLDWDDVDNAIGYNLQGRRIGAPNFGTANSLVSFKSISGLPSNKTFEWQVRSQCAYRNSDWTPLQNFTTPPILRIEANLLIVEDKVQSIKLFDLTGRLLVISKTSTLHLDVPSGLYIGEVATEQMHHTERVLVR